MDIPIIGGFSHVEKIGQAEFQEDLSFAGRLYDKTVWAQMIRDGGDLIAMSLVIEPAKPGIEYIPQDEPADDNLWTTDRCRHNENTMFKVAEALKKTGLSDRQILDAVIHMQNEGILFRERMP